MDSDRELSVLERVLAREGDTKVASILALDLFIVGVDTVNILQLEIFPLNDMRVIESSYLQTSTAVASVLYQLALHPEKQALAYDEICNVLPQRDASLEVTNIDNLKYLKACIKETLRFVKATWVNTRIIRIRSFCNKLLLTFTAIIIDVCV